MMNGTDFTIYIPTDDVDNDDGTTTWEELAVATSCSISISTDLPDATTKDDAGWSKIIAGQKSHTMSFDGLTQTGFLDGVNSARSADDGDFDWLYYYLTNRSKIKVAMGVGGSGQSQTGRGCFYGDGYISSLEVNADNEGVTTYSGTFTSTGELEYIVLGSFQSIFVTTRYPDS